MKWWCEQNIKNKIIVPGTALYKMENNNWSSTEIKRQIDVTRDYRNISSYGATHFTMNQILRNVKTIKDVFKASYATQVLTPLIKYPWIFYLAIMLHLMLHKLKIFFFMFLVFTIFRGKRGNCGNYLFLNIIISLKEKKFS